MTFKRDTVKAVDLSIVMEQDRFSMRLTDDGLPVMSGGKDVGAVLALASMRYRIRVFGGTVEIERTPTGGIRLVAELKLDGSSS